MIKRHRRLVVEAIARSGRTDLTIRETARGHIAILDRTGKILWVVPGTPGNRRWEATLRSRLRSV